MPASIVGRLVEAEYLAIIERINATLHGFGYLSLLLPFLVIDMITMTFFFCIVDPFSQSGHSRSVAGRIP